MKVITYSITLQEPTLVTAPGGDPNGATALDYLPGSVLRGAIIGKYVRQQRQRHPGYQLDAAEPTSRRLFFDGTTRFLNGYLLGANKRRALPAPLSWQREKGKESPIRDLAVEPLPPEDRGTWVGVGRTFCVPLGDASVRLVQAERHLAVHTARNRRLGRAQEASLVGPEEDPGAVYRYESLAAGQTFSAAILCDEDAVPEVLLPLIAGAAALGGARNGGYGWAHFRDARVEDGPWSETESPGGSTPDGRFIVTLLSDGLLRDGQGQFAAAADLVARAVSSILKCEVRLEDHFLRGQMVGGFNRKWGLPLPQALAVAMGSVFVCAAPGCQEEDLRILEAKGIGERRAEGFGRVAVNGQNRSRWTLPEKPPAKQAPSSWPVGTGDRKRPDRLAHRQPSGSHPSGCRSGSPRHRVE
jgi:CRISPR-associated protein Csx10